MFRPKGSTDFLPGRRFAGVFGALAIGAFGCSKQSEGTGAACDWENDPSCAAQTRVAGKLGSELTYYADVKPIVDAACAECHQPGGIGPIDLSRPEPLVEWAELVREQVISRTMPPWHAAPDCNEFEHVRALSDEHRKTIALWIDGGRTIGDPSTEGAALPVTDAGLSRVDIEVPLPEPFIAQEDDQYQCFVLDWPANVEWPANGRQYLTGYNVVPTNPAVVHHANIYLTYDRNTIAALNEKDAQDPNPGYRCFGGVFQLGVEYIGAWAPGGFGVDLPRGTGIQIQRNSKLVVEVHYSLAAKDLSPDQLSLMFSAEPAVERRGLIVPIMDVYRWPSGGLPIPAGEADVVHSYSMDPDRLRAIAGPWLEWLGNDVLVYGAGLHMHYLGKRGVLKIERGGDPEQSECLLQIDDWDFSWQTGYVFKQPIPFTIGEDRVYIECAFDNSESHQPTINGVPQAPQDTNWGLGSRDEMCIGLAYVTNRCPNPDDALCSEAR